MTENNNGRSNALYKPMIEEHTLSETLNNKSLTLRKKKLDIINHTKRVKYLSSAKEGNKNPKDNEFIINLETLNVSDAIKNARFDTGAEYFNNLFSLTESSSIDEVKYAIGHIRLFMEDQRNAHILNSYNNNVISDLLDCLDKHIKDYTICYEIMWIFINFSLKITDDLGKTIGLTILSPRGYRLWLKIFEYDNQALNCNLIWMLNNIIGNNNETSLNLIISNFYFNQLLNYFKTIASTLNIFEPKDEMTKNICSLLSNIIKEEYSDYSAHINKLQSVQVLLSFCTTNNYDAYLSLLLPFTVEKVIKESSIRKYILDSGLFKEIIDEKKFLSIYDIRLYSSRIIGLMNYYHDFPLETNIKLIQIFKESLNSNSGILRKDCFWCLCNLTFANNVADEIIKNEGMIEEIMKAVQVEVWEIKKEALNCLLNTMVSASMNGFLSLGKWHVFEFLVDIVQKESSAEIVELALKGINHCLWYGESIKEPLGFNVYTERFKTMGGIEIMEHLSNSKIGQSPLIYQIILEIQIGYFKEENEYPLLKEI